MNTAAFKMPAMKCDACGKPIGQNPGECYVGSTNGRVWHYGCRPPEKSTRKIECEIPVNEVAQVSDDTLEDELHSAIWEAGKTAEPLDGYPVVTREQKSVFNYGRDCATMAIEEVVLKLVRERLQGQQS